MISCWQCASFGVWDLSGHKIFYFQASWGVCWVILWCSLKYPQLYICQCCVLCGFKSFLSLSALTWQVEAGIVTDTVTQEGRVRPPWSSPSCPHIQHQPLHKSNLCQIIYVLRYLDIFLLPLLIILLSILSSNKMQWK